MCAQSPLRLILMRSSTYSFTILTKHPSHHFIPLSFPLTKTEKTIFVAICIPDQPQLILSFNIPETLYFGELSYLPFPVQVLF